MKEEKFVYLPPIDFVRFRPHRGTLAEAMKLAQDFADLDQMGEFVAKGYLQADLTIGDIDVVILDDPIFDRRIGWVDCRSVCIKRIGQDEFDPPRCVGFCATQFCEPEAEQ